MWDYLKVFAMFIGFFFMLVTAFCLLTLICRSFVDWRQDRKVQAGLDAAIAKQFREGGNGQT